MIDRHLFAEFESPAPLPDGLRYEPRFLDESEQADLLTTIDSREWSRELQRRVQHYGFRYDYKARRVDSSMRLGPLPKFVDGILRALPAVVAVDQGFDQLIVNEYLPGQGIAAHIDCEPCFEDHIAIVSLGWAYEMEFQRVRPHTVATLTLASGSLLVLSGPARYDWTHQIRPRLRDRGLLRRRRVSLTFRKVRVGE